MIEGKREFMRRAGFPEEEIPPPDPPGMTDEERSQESLAYFVARDGLPTIEDYRKTYRLFRVEWPGDDEARRMYPLMAPADGVA